MTETLIKKMLLTNYGIIDILNISVCNAGHINNTYIVNCTDRSFIFQRINTSIFKSPENLMKNIEKITAHIRQKIVSLGGDATREVLNIVPTLNGKSYFYYDNEYYRVYNYIKHAVAYSSAPNAEVLAESGKAFGRFQYLLDDFDATVLFETIPNFHNTVSRYMEFVVAYDNNLSHRKETALHEIEFINNRKDNCSYITDRLASGTFKTRVTHNDTKLNNVMIDDSTMKAICVIDLDTVMPGSSLYDFGDAIRFGASTAKEDESDLSLVNFDLNLFESYTRGYLEGVCGSLTTEEILDLPMGAYLMTFECGMRFLTDYLNGDTYFRIEYPDHNLIRARNQFKLVSDMEVKLHSMKSIIQKITEEI